MKKTTILAVLALTLTTATTAQTQVSPEIKPYVDYLENTRPTTAKDYILSLFQKHDLVILCERDHRDVTQYDLFLDVMNDPYFIEHVGTVFTEVGSQKLNPALNDFLRDGSLSEAQVEELALSFQRNAMTPLWDKTNFMYFIQGIHEINTGLPADKKLEMYPTNPMMIEGEPTPEKFDAMMVNYMRFDYLLADFITENFDRMKRENPAAKALVILNYRHAYKFSFDEFGGLNAGHLLTQLYLPGKVANVLINNYNSGNSKALRDGRWDAAFRVADIENAGFDFVGTPFGDDEFDYYSKSVGKSYKDVFNGFVYYLPFEQFETRIGYPGLLDDTAAERSIVSGRLLREAMAGLQARPYPDQPYPSVEEYKQQYNTLRKGKLHNLEQLDAAINKWLE